MSGVAKVSGPPVALSTSSVYPERTPDAFEMAARLGYDGVEVMVYTDPVSQAAEALLRLQDYHQLPIVSVHAPSLLLTQRVWGREPWEKLRRAQELAERVGAGVVVLHPPFRWQREYVRGFETGLAAMAEETRRALRGGEHVPAAGRRQRGGAVRPALGPDRARRAEHHPGPLPHRRLRLRRPDHGDRARQPPGPRAPGRRHRLAGRPGARRAPGARPRRAALRRAAQPAPARRVPRCRGRRGEDQPRADQGGPDGGPGRVAGFRPAAPGRRGAAAPAECRVHNHGSEQHPDHGRAHRRRSRQGRRAGPAGHPGRAGGHGQGVRGRRGGGDPRAHQGRRGPAHAGRSAGSPTRWPRCARAPASSSSCPPAAR